MTDEKTTGDRITCIQNHLPTLEAGAYELTLILDVACGEEGTYEHDEIKKTFSFTISGERFALTPADVQAVFPPAGSLGDHFRVLPHVLLNRSTLPWEREPWEQKSSPGSNTAPGEGIPWMALLLFDEAENTKEPAIEDRFFVETMTLDKLWSNDILKRNEKTLETFYQPEADQDGGDQVTVVQASKKLLETIVPSASELAYLAHVRQSGESSDGQEYAVVIANRPPRKGRMSYAHLVSVEGRYTEKGTFDYLDAKDTDLIPLVSLYSWRFACQDEQHSFLGLMTTLGGSSRTLRLPTPENGNESTDAERYLAMGCVPLPHTLRQGAETVSWYHGPLIPGENTTTDEEAPPLPIRSSDRLVRYNPEYGMFDVSYAAAWELGRLLTLQSKTVSTDLYRWKRTHAVNAQAVERGLTHLPFDRPDVTLDLPDSVQAWFERLQRLEGVPFNYMVPDERLLPKETIGFFSVDWLWLECLLDGAFSIGRASKADRKLDSSLKAAYPDHLSRPSAHVTGVILRSDVVAGWPDLQVDGYEDVITEEDDLESAVKMDCLPIQRLSKNILIYMFKGVVQTLYFHLKPEAAHFALEDWDGVKDWNKDITYKNDENHVLAKVSLKDRSHRVIGFQVKDDAFNSALFAPKMITAVEGFILHPIHPKP